MVSEHIHVVCRCTRVVDPWNKGIPDALSRLGLSPLAFTCLPAVAPALHLKTGLGARFFRRLLLKGCTLYHAGAQTGAYGAKAPASICQQSETRCTGGRLVQAIPRPPGSVRPSLLPRLGHGSLEDNGFIPRIKLRAGQHVLDATF